MFHGYSMFYSVLILGTQSEPVPNNLSSQVVAAGNLLSLSTKLLRIPSTRI